MNPISEVTAMTPDETEAAARVALGQIQDVVVQRARIQAARSSIQGMKDLGEARRVLETDHGAIFAENGVDFTLFGMTGRLQGPRGEVGTSKKSRAARKRERQNRKNGRRKA